MMRLSPILARLIRSAALTAALALPAASFADISISIGIAPPVLPVYAQPVCPGDGYIWTPGYWAYGPEGYYWVPGVWVVAPQPGFLWTPGYWGWSGNAFLWHAGYWGPHIGFYGGVNYGFGYIGHGYEGGYWQGNHFAYNQTVNNVNVTKVTNVYNKTVIVNNNTTNNVTNNRVSYVGGNGGLQAQPTPQEQAALREQHVQPTQNQLQHEQLARADRGQLASVNNGRPAVAAQARVGDRTSAIPARGVPPAALAASRNSVNQRQGNQQGRIANGVNNGQMTAGEAARAENRQADIHQQVRTDRQANGGTLTPGERAQVNREQNGASRQIYRENHNAATQPAVARPQQPQARSQAPAQPRVEQPRAEQPRAEQPRAEAPRGEGGGRERR